MARVLIQPNEILIDLPQGTPLVRALWQAGAAVESPCGGFGVCGKCKVRFIGGEVPAATEEEIRHLTALELQEGWRLSCRHRVTADTEIFVPAESRPTIAQVLTSAVERPVELQPAVRRVVVKLPAPAVSDERSDLQRLKDALWEQHGIMVAPDDDPLTVVRTLPQVLREAGFVAAVTLHIAEPGAHARLLKVQPYIASEPLPPLLGIAFDIGTTTLVGYLIDLQSGEELAYAARINPQVQYGDDVVSRLSYVYHDPSGLRHLQQAVVQGLNEIIAECCQAAQVQPTDIYEVVTAGNTVMMHFLLGVNTNSIAVAPYVPVFTESMSVEARQVGLRVHQTARLTTLPCIAGYVGADTVAVVLTHLWEPDGATVVALDIGTNGEVVLRHKGNYYCTSAAAGPAFEGGRIYHGTRAERGAVSQISLQGKNSERWLEVGTIGGEPAKGICGSGLIDAAASLFELGILDEGGRLNGERAPAEWKMRMVQANEQKAFLLVMPESAGNAEGVVLTQRDVRELQLAKGSIRAVTEVLLQTAGVSWDEVQALYVAGAFGMYMNVKSAKTIGLLPPLEEERVQQVGNAAGAGARIALRSIVERQRASVLAKRMQHVPMTGNPRYEEALMETLGFGEYLLSY